MSFTRCIISFTLLLSLPIDSAFSADLIPFSLPWDDGDISADSALNFERQDVPAGKNGFIHIEDGHFFDGSGQRIRLLGVNLSFSGNYPSHEQAGPLAERMAKYGINCVRFHHTDTSRAPRGIWKAGTSDKQTLDPVNLDRMDYLINELRKNGIYSNINLKIGREVVEGDGFTDVDRLPGYDKGPDHYFPRMIELQKKYAKDLLTHKNPYTGNRYVDEPSLAIVEINNESGLVNKWAGSDLDSMPQQYIDPLQTDWNTFLKNKYQSTSALRKAWAPAGQGSGDELLTRGLSGWSLQQLEQAKGSMNIVPDGPDSSDALEIKVTAIGEASWHAQMIYHGLRVKQGGYYKVRMQLRAEPDRSVSIGIKMDHDPWQSLDDTVNVDLTGQWKTIELAFSPSQDDSRARLDISGLANKTGSLWVANTSMIDSTPDGLPDGQSLERNNIEWISRGQFGQRAIPIRRDWIEFLIERESQYYSDMNHYLKEELGLQSIIGGTQLHFGTELSQLENDFIDIHGYWKHPSFPNRPWDSIDWVISNESMIPAENNTMERLMLSRIDGRAFTCTEYNHPAPITFSSETIPLLAAYAAFQDWDGIFFYSYSHNNNYAGHSINSFFDICGHTPKMMCMPAAYNMLVRGDISPAQQTVAASITREEYTSMIVNRNGSLWFTPMSELGISGTAPYQHKTVLRIDDSKAPITNPDFELTRRSMEADTGELRWNQIPKKSAHTIIRSQKTKGFVGFVDTSVFDLGNGIKLEVGETMQDWANILLTYLGTRNGRHRWLLTATGYHENEGMVWKDEAKTSVGNKWGSGPPLVEPVPLRLTIPLTHENPYLSTIRVNVYALDNLAKPGKDLTQSVHTSDNGLIVDLMKSPGALWYEISFVKDTSVENSMKH